MRKKDYRVRNEVCVITKTPSAFWVEKPGVPVDVSKHRKEGDAIRRASALNRTKGRYGRS